MAITEGSRHHLHQRLEEALGSEEAVTLMEHLPPTGWAGVATSRDLDHLGTITARDLDAVHQQLRAELKAETAKLAWRSAPCGPNCIPRSAPCGPNCIPSSAPCGPNCIPSSAPCGPEMVQMGASLQERIDDRHAVVMASMAELRAELHQDRRAGQRQVIGALVVALIAIIITVAALGDRGEAG
jgi:hypothetical protein